jgi:hypothetical protein
VKIYNRRVLYSLFLRFALTERGRDEKGRLEGSFILPNQIQWVLFPKETP